MSGHSKFANIKHKKEKKIYKRHKYCERRTRIPIKIENKYNWLYTKDNKKQVKFREKVYMHRYRGHQDQIWCSR